MAEQQYRGEMQSFLNVIRSQRHDYNFHVQTIAGLIRQNKMEDCLRYINALEEDVAIMNAVLPVRDPAIAALIHNFRLMAVRQGTELHVDIHYDLSQIATNVYETNKIISNLLQNAIDEVSTHEDKSHGIWLTILKRGEYCVIRVSNKLKETLSQEDLDNIYRQGYTTKQGHEGVGLSSLRTLVGRYKGVIYTQVEGDEIQFVARVDDIAWLRINPKDGRLYAINPEAGFFGVAPGTNAKTNFNALESTKKNTIFTNVAINNDDMTVWWEGLDKNPPENATEWTGKQVNGKEFVAEGGKLANTNSIFTAPAINCPCISPEFENPQGVPISAIVFGGRRAKTAPLVYQARDWEHGVFVGATMASETTAAAAGAVGVVRRDPMAMKPFVGYNMADYFGHWFEMGKKMEPGKAPKIFHVNWFRRDDDDNFLWPGFGDNMRVLNWIIDRCEGKVDAKETAIGYVPNKEDLNLEGLDISDEVIDELLSVKKEYWVDDIANQKEFFAQFGDRLPKEITSQLEKLENSMK